MTAHYTKQQREWLAKGLTCQGRVRQRSSKLQSLVESHADLLEACKNCLTTLLVIQQPRTSNSVASDRQLATIAAEGLRAAIAKAEGED